MKEKHLKIFAGVFVFLLILFFVTKPRQRGVNVDELVQTLLIGFVQDDVRTIEVYKQTSGEPAQMVFRKDQDGHWRIMTHHGARAQKSRVDQLLNNLIEMTGNVRSSDSRHLETYGITDHQGVQLLLKGEGDKTLANLIVGKSSEDPNSGFVRFEGKDKVYAVDRNILSSLGVYGGLDTLSRFNHSSFVSLQAVDQKADTLEWIGMVVNRKEMVIKKVETEVVVDDSTGETRKDSEWVLMQGSREISLDQKAVEDFLRDVTQIRALKVADRIGGGLTDMEKSSQYGFDRPSHYLVYKRPEAPQENVLFGRVNEDESRMMLVQYEGLVYHVGKSVFERAFKWMDELPQKTR
ncbi:MAG TPA: DUF4340 domain-containing protein [bacterium]|nr:DUF4340 domain-containing protein [bacterium]